MNYLQVRSRGLLNGIVLVCAMAIACSLVSACTTVTVRNAKVTETNHFGVVEVRIVPDREVMSVVVTRGLGLVLGAQSTTLGFLSESVFLAPDGSACRAFILISNGVEEVNLRHLLQQQPQLSQICVIKREEL